MKISKEVFNNYKRLTNLTPEICKETDYIVTISTSFYVYAHWFRIVKTLKETKKIQRRLIKQKYFSRIGQVKYYSYGPMFYEID
jgi:hypothetical protein